MKCIEKTKTKEFFVITEKNYKKGIEWLFLLYGKEVQIRKTETKKQFDTKECRITYTLNDKVHVLILFCGNIAILDKENKRIYI